MNAMNIDCVEKITLALEELAKDVTLKVLVVTGEGRAFCAGAQLGPPGDGEPIYKSEGEGVAVSMLNSWNPMMKTFYNFPRPMVSAINGAAAGGGVGLSLVCDIAVCCKSAKFKLTFTPNLSLVPDLGATFQLPRLIGRQRAIGLSLLGDTISGEEAGRIGLVYKCVPDEQLMSTVHDIAMRLADGPTAAQYAVRRIMDKSLNNTYDEQLAEERKFQKVLGDTGGMNHGAVAFLLKKKPNFRFDPEFIEKLSKL
mgnify:CR=1 FL=1